MTKLRVCLVSSEIAPFAKTGGLADVAAGLSRFLGREGHDVRLFMPAYPAAQERAPERRPRPELQRLTLTAGSRRYAASVSTIPLPASSVDVHLIECPELYGRDTVYTQDPDEHLRFALLSRAAIESCQRLQWAPDVFHCNDWHTGLLPLYLKTGYAWDGLLARSRTVLTIHNIGYQGVFSIGTLAELGLQGERHLLPKDDVAADRVNFLKTGTVWADALTTVSRTYAREIQTADFGMGLEEVLREHRDKLIGIVNGVDYDDWSPETDRLIPHRYSRDDLSGKQANKVALLKEFGLGGAADAPLMGIVARLTYQKGFQLLPDVLPQLFERHACALVVLGSGEEQYERYFQWLRDRYPARVAFYRGHNDELAHRIEAASDLFLMPSRYEPCGLNQMYSLRYGTVPVVRRTGGLADTVTAYDPATGEGTGFVFEPFTPEALFEALSRALALYRDRAAWSRLVQSGMAEDFSWARQGPHYVALYESLRAAAAGD